MPPAPPPRRRAPPRWSGGGPGRRRRWGRRRPRSVGSRRGWPPACSTWFRSARRHAHRGFTMDIAGSRVLVTGASSGIGAALARLLARRGATVGLLARRRERLEEVLADCRADAPQARLWVADLADVARAEQVALEAWEAMGPLDCVVNNAGVP